MDIDTDDIKSTEIHLSYLKGLLQGAVNRRNLEEEHVIELTNEVNKFDNILREKKKKAWEKELATVAEASEPVSDEMKAKKKKRIVGESSE